MKILIAPDSFKETLTALEVAAFIQQGIGKAYETTTCALADGGEGTMHILTTLLGGEICETLTRDPLGKEIVGKYGFIPKTKTAIIELAEASGLQLVPKEKRNPLSTTTYGTGLLIKAAIEKGAEEIILTLGGSATNDAGTGLAAALGVQFLGEFEEPFIPTGETLQDVKKIDTRFSLLQEVTFKIATDVTNPILGKKGAAHVFAKQKGATTDQIDVLENQMAEFVDLLERKTNTKLKKTPGLGAAGGSGLLLHCFAETEICSGIELVANLVGLEEKIKAADVIITGEGKFDRQSKDGKVISYISKICTAHQKPLIVMCGSSEIKTSKTHKIIALNNFFELEECLSKPKECLLEVSKGSLLTLLQKMERA